MQGQARVSEILEQVLQHPNAGQAEHLEATLVFSRRNETRLANNEIIQDSMVDDRKLTLRATIDGGLGTAVTNDLTPAGIGRAIQRATLAAEVTRGGDFPGFEPNGPPLKEIPKAFDEETVTLLCGRKADDLHPAFKKTRDANLLLAGSLHTGAYEIALHNTQGLQRYHRGTAADARINVLKGLEPGVSTAYSGQLSVDYQNINLESLTDRALQRTLLGLKPKSIKADTYDVILEPEAVSELMEWLSFIGFSNRAMQEGTSFLSKRIGESITGTDVTIIDDGLSQHGYGIPTPFDGEGAPRKILTLIDKGVGQSSVHDRTSAARTGCASTGHAPLSIADFVDDALPANMLMLGGKEDQNSLLERLDRGLWISRFHYVNGMLEPRRAVMTGLTRDGTFWVDHGKVQHGVRNLRFTDSILEAFSRIDGLSTQLTSLPMWWNPLGAMSLPAILIRGLKFTGTTDE